MNRSGTATICVCFCLLLASDDSIESPNFKSIADGHDEIILMMLLFDKRSESTIFYYEGAFTWFMHSNDEGSRENSIMIYTSLVAAGKQASSRHAVACCVSRKLNSAIKRNCNCFDIEMIIGIVPLHYFPQNSLNLMSGLLLLMTSTKVNEFLFHW